MGKSHHGKQKWAQVEKTITHQAKSSERRKIVFVPPRRKENGLMLNNHSLMENNRETNGKRSSIMNEKVIKKDGKKERVILASKKDELFPHDVVTKYLHWGKLARPGPGMMNYGNTCYLNATLQCLVNIPALAQVMQDRNLFKKEENTWNRQKIRSVTSMFRDMISGYWSRQGGGGQSRREIFGPREMYNRVGSIARHFRKGRQEDSHEYLRLLLDNMHEESLKVHGIKLCDGKIAETTGMLVICDIYSNNIH
jgi:uncharacterized UBP type Zn finger protein